MGMVAKMKCKCASCGRQRPIGGGRGGDLLCEDCFAQLTASGFPEQPSSQQAAPVHCALLAMPRAGVADPRAWCSHLVDSCETLGGLGEVLRVACESPETDLDADGMHAALWGSVSEQVAADLAVACYVLARVATRLAVTAPARAPCAECGHPSDSTCRMCGAPVCGDHRALTMSIDGVQGLCPPCADDFRLMTEAQGVGA